MYKAQPFPLDSLPESAGEDPEESRNSLRNPAEGRDLLGWRKAFQVRCTNRYSLRLIST